MSEHRPAFEKSGFYLAHPLGPPSDLIRTGLRRLMPQTLANRVPNCAEISSLRARSRGANEGARSATGAQRRDELLRSLGCPPLDAGDDQSGRMIGRAGAEILRDHFPPAPVFGRRGRVHELPRALCENLLTIPSMLGPRPAGSAGTTSRRSASGATNSCAATVPTERSSIIRVFAAFFI